MTPDSAILGLAPLGILIAVIVVTGVAAVVLHFARNRNS